jgi:DNA-binding NtrC family response regulator
MSDTFRRAYRQLSEGETESIEQLKDHASRFEQELDTALARGLGERKGAARYIALSRTALEEAVMWATKAVST